MSNEVAGTFFIESEPICLHKFTEMAGNFSSPEWPEKYENEAFCRWEFNVPEGMVIKVLHVFIVESKV